MGYKEQFEFWLEDSYFDEATKQELLAIRNDEKEIEDRFYKRASRGDRRGHEPYEHLHGAQSDAGSG